MTSAHRNHGGGADALSPAFLILEGERRRPVGAGHAAVNLKVCQRCIFGSIVQVALVCSGSLWRVWLRFSVRVGLL